MNCLPFQNDFSRNQSIGSPSSIDVRSEQYVHRLFAHSVSECRALVTPGRRRTVFVLPAPTKLSSSLPTFTNGVLHQLTVSEGTGQGVRTVFSPQVSGVTCERTARDVHAISMRQLSQVQVAEETSVLSGSILQSIQYSQDECSICKSISGMEFHVTASEDYAQDIAEVKINGPSEVLGGYVHAECNEKSRILTCCMQSILFSSSTSLGHDSVM